jgi:hypothetical protein
MNLRDVDPQRQALDASNVAVADIVKYLVQLTDRCRDAEQHCHPSIIQSILPRIDDVRAMLTLFEQRVRLEHKAHLPKEKKRKTFTEL